MSGTGKGTTVHEQLPNFKKNMDSTYFKKPIANTFSRFVLKLFMIMLIF